MTHPIPQAPAILTTTVGSYPVPQWLSALPSEQAVVDATRVVFDTQRQAGIDLPTDGELYRFDVNHPAVAPPDHAPDRAADAGASERADRFQASGAGGRR